ncbi:MAG: hypothetical protein IPM97_11305 [Bdellovibrionaceae bacterium]|nr:hypothetical protein [Pseudobdellovibrionaceae bacterium]
MKRQPFLFMLLLLLVGPTSQAHEGHDHDGPAAIQAPKGGVIKSLKKSFIEVVSKGKNIKIYIYDSEIKPKSTSGFKLSAKAVLPRTKKQEPLVLTAQDTFYEASYDAKGLHRYTLELLVKDPESDGDNKLSFTIESKR